MILIGKMTRKEFSEKKQSLLSIIQEKLMEKDICEKDKKSLDKLFHVLNEYSIDNRLQKKGSLTYTIIDSLDLNFSLGEQFIIFDNEI